MPPVYPRPRGKNEEGSESPDECQGLHFSLLWAPGFLHGKGGGIV